MKKYLLILCLLPTAALAYFDIGTGSYIFQVIVASSLGIIYTVRHHIRVFLGKIMFWKKEAVSQSKDETEPKTQNEFPNGG